MDTLKKSITVGLIGLLGALVVPTAGSAESIYDRFHVKHGTIASDEDWSGKVLIIGDVTIPKTVTVTVAPGTWVVFSNYDIHNAGQLPHAPELIVEGVLNSPKSTSAPAKLLTITDPEVQPLLTVADDEKVEVAPQEVLVNPMREKFRKYKMQYAIVWAVMYSLGVLL